MPMSATSIVRARIDPKVKEEAEAVLEAIGLTVSDAVRLMMMRVAQERKLPFEPLIPNEQTIQAMLEARRGGTQFRSVDDLMADLNADD
jgi:DNA-damage-inducible protein J